MDVESFILLYKEFLRSHLEYAESVWNPHYMYLIDDLEKVQKRATKILRQCVDVWITGSIWNFWIYQHWYL